MVNKMKPHITSKVNNYAPIGGVSITKILDYRPTPRLPMGRSPQEGTLLLNGAADGVLGAENG